MVIIYGSKPAVYIQKKHNYRCCCCHSLMYRTIADLTAPAIGKSRSANGALEISNKVITILYAYREPDNGIGYTCGQPVLAVH